jgi:hypothetical protein
MFNCLVRDGPVVFNQKGGKRGHHDSVRETPAFDVKGLKKILKHVLLESLVKGK